MEIDFEMEVGHTWLRINVPVGIFFADRFLRMSEKLTVELLPFPARPVDNIVESFLNFFTGPGKVCFDNCHAEPILVIPPQDAFSNCLWHLFARLSQFAYRVLYRSQTGSQGLSY